MRAFIFCLMFTSIVGCSSSPSTGVIARECGKGRLYVDELESFGFKPELGKVTIMRIFATWCPYCKEDLEEMSKRIQSQQWPEDQIQVMLLNYNNSGDDQQDFDRFKNNVFPGYRIPPGMVQLVFLNQDYKYLQSRKAKDAKPLFADWRGVPYALIFGKDGRLVYRGHFTSSPNVQASHYDLIASLTKEQCKP